MNQSLTVVLPIHNAEATLRASVDRVLEVSSDLTPDVQILIMDDGSTDDSYDIARELATRFPQVRVVRQPRQRGLGPTIRNARRRLSSDVVMVHDGVSEMNAEQLRALWDRRVDAGQPADVDVTDLLRPRQNQVAMAAAHRRLMSFQLITPGSSLDAEEKGPASTGSSTTESRSHAAHRSADARNLGVIPSLPQPNFMGTISNFALGE